MLKQKLSFVYFLAWLVLGAFLGVMVLLYRGDVQLLVNPSGSQQNLANSSTNQVVSYAEAVKQAAPAVVSIQTIVWTNTTDTNETNSINDIGKEGFLGKNSPHRPKNKLKRLLALALLSEKQVIFLRIIMSYQIETRFALGYATVVLLQLNLLALILTPISLY